MYGLDDVWAEVWEGVDVVVIGHAFCDADGVYVVDLNFFGLHHFGSDGVVFFCVACVSAGFTFGDGCGGCPDEG